MSRAQAFALRRLLLLVAALGTTLAAHMAAGGGERLLPVAPVIWGSLVMAGALLGRRHGPWRPRGPLTIFALLVGTQALLHTAMSVAPWAFGLSVHHGAPLVTPAAVVLHLGAAALLAWLVSRAERLLSATQRALWALHVAIAPRAAAARPPAMVTVAAVAPRLTAVHAAIGARGPPARSS
jgi:hypothetical protein